MAVKALDTFGNPVPDVSIGSLTLSPAATLVNFAATATAATGLATFGGLSVTTCGTYTMTASGGGLNATSTSFVISPAAVATISFVNQPGTTHGRQYHRSGYRSGHRFVRQSRARPDPAAWR